MKHHIIIDDQSKIGKGLLQIVEALTKANDKGVEILDDNDDDEILIKKMKAGVKSGILNIKEKAAFFKKLKAVAGL